MSRTGALPTIPLPENQTNPPASPTIEEKQEWFDAVNKSDFLFIKRVLKDRFEQNHNTRHCNHPLNWVDEKGDSAIHIAAKSGAKTALRSGGTITMYDLLVKYGANVYKINSVGETPLRLRRKREAAVQRNVLGAQAARLRRAVEESAKNGARIAALKKSYEEYRRLEGVKNSLDPEDISYSYDPAKIQFIERRLEELKPEAQKFVRIRRSALERQRSGANPAVVGGEGPYDPSFGPVRREGGAVTTRGVGRTAIPTAVASLAPLAQNAAGSVRQPGSFGGAASRGALPGSPPERSQRANFPPSSGGGRPPRNPRAEGGQEMDELPELPTAPSVDAPSSLAQSAGGPSQPVTSPSRSADPFEPWARPRRRGVPAQPAPETPAPAPAAAPRRGVFARIAGFFRKVFSPRTRVNLLDPGAVDVERARANEELARFGQNPYFRIDVSLADDHHNEGAHNLRALEEELDGLMGNPSPVGARGVSGPFYYTDSLCFEGLVPEAAAAAAAEEAVQMRQPSGRAGLHGSGPGSLPQGSVGRSLRNRSNQSTHESIV